MHTTHDQPGLAGLPEPPYYAVIFSSIRTDVEDGYSETAQKMVDLAAQMPGFLGVESARDTGIGITVSYWKDEESIRHWRQHLEHAEARRQGREKWYAGYRLRVARVERAYGM